MWRRLLDSPWPYFTAAGLLLLVAIATQFEIRFPSRPEGTVEEIGKLRDRDDLSVLFVLVDTLRADRLGAYGYSRPTTPNIDALGQKGIVFTNVLSQSSWTKTSMAPRRCCRRSVSARPATARPGSGATDGSRPTSASTRASSST
jgi:hypothetical protein